jgi:hypothetical protein
MWVLETLSLSFYNTNMTQQTNLNESHYTLTSSFLTNKLYRSTCQALETKEYLKNPGQKKKKR